MISVSKYLGGANLGFVPAPLTLVTPPHLAHTTSTRYISFSHRLWRWVQTTSPFRSIFHCLSRLLAKEVEEEYSPCYLTFFASHKVTIRHIFTSGSVEFLKHNVVHIFTSRWHLGTRVTRIMLLCWKYDYNIASFRKFNLNKSSNLLLHNFH